MWKINIETAELNTDVKKYLYMIFEKADNIEIVVVFSKGIDSNFSQF